jgi:serine-type D-Ala-D-Ala endopeptidase (penicillin-binding protein 7)
MRDTIRRAALTAALTLGLAAGAAQSADAISLIDGPSLMSAAVLVIDEETGEVLYNKNAQAIVPIASITKLMTAMVTLDAGLPLEEEIEVTQDDVFATRGAGIRSNLVPRVKLTRNELLELALMASENRAAAALARSYPGGTEAFVQAMNNKAAELDMSDSRFVESTGLSSSNVSSAGDLAKLVRAAKDYPLIGEYSTQPTASVQIGKRSFKYVNTNGLVRGGSWEIGLSKTGFIREAGRCLVMQVKLAARSVIIVLLDSVGKYTRIGDANRIRQWLEPGFLAPALPVAKPIRIKQPVRATRSGGGRVRAQLKPPSVR